MTNRSQTYDISIPDMTKQSQRRQINLKRDQFKTQIFLFIKEKSISYKIISKKTDHYKQGKSYQDKYIPYITDCIYANQSVFSP
jgi:hypothetical protein